MRQGKYRVTVEIDEELHNPWVQRAKEQGLTLSGWIKMLAMKDLKKK